MGILAGKRVLVTGVLTEASIAFATARIAQEQGATVVLSNFGRALSLCQRIAKRLTQEAPVVELDVTNTEHLGTLADRLREHVDTLDGVVHSIGFAPRSALDGRFTDVTTRETWRITMDVSAYSLFGLTRAFKPLMVPGSSILSLSYLGAEKVIRNYNVMGVAKAALECSTRYLADDLGLDGIRINAVSAGPLKTLAAAGIKGMRSMLGENADKTPMRRNIEQDDVADAALYLCSHLARNVTGEVLHVDAGQNIVGPVSMG